MTSAEQYFLPETNNEEFSHSWLSGLQTTPHYHTPLDGTRVLGILFEPPGLYCLFGADMQNLRDITVDGQQTLPDDFLEFVETIPPRAHEPVAHQELFQWLCARELCHAEDWIVDFCRQILAKRGTVNLESAYQASGHSARHAANLFRRATGVTPKVLCRIHRRMSSVENLRTDDGAIIETGSMLRFTSRGQEHTSQAVDCRPDEIMWLRSTQGPITADYRYVLAESEKGCDITLMIECRARGWARIIGPVIGLAAWLTDRSQVDMLKTLAVRLLGRCGFIAALRCSGHCNSAI